FLQLSISIRDDNCFVIQSESEESANLVNLNMYEFVQILRKYPQDDMLPNLVISNGCEKSKRIFKSYF
ncbi:MAG: hypothetical protein CL662_07430, partial [Bacteroidetes bacterium]|nr:hypothetical protein [Bacteroidota bacterium]